MRRRRKLPHGRHIDALPGTDPLIYTKMFSCFAVTATVMAVSEIIPPGTWGMPRPESGTPVRLAALAGMTRPGGHLMCVMRSGVPPVLGEFRTGRSAAMEGQPEAESVAGSNTERGG